MRQVSNKTTRIMPAKLQPHTPTNPRQILADKSATKCEWIRPLPSQKGNFVFERSQQRKNSHITERTVGPKSPRARASSPRNEAIDPIQADDPHSTAVASRGRGNGDACSWLDLDRGRGEGGGGGLSRAEPSQREPVPSRWPLACGGWTRLVGGETDNTRTDARWA